MHPHAPADSGCRAVCFKSAQFLTIQNSTLPRLSAAPCSLDVGKVWDLDLGCRRLAACCARLLLRLLLRWATSCCCCCSSWTCSCWKGSARQTHALSAVLTLAFVSRPPNVHAWTASPCVGLASVVGKRVGRVSPSAHGRTLELLRSQRWHICSWRVGRLLAEERRLLRDNTLNMSTACSQGHMHAQVARRWLRAP